MKIEKVNDHQIRCTLTKADLADRELKISELAYGTEKAKSLFRDMMQQASYEFGFEAEDIPLMIEAIPINAECIVLIITKVEDPEELDTRFSKFAPSVHEEEDSYDTDTDSEFSDTEDEVLDLFKRIHDNAANEAGSNAVLSKESPSNASKSAKDTVEIAEATHIYTFSSMGNLTRGAHIVANWFDGESSLYKDTSANQYKLVVRIGSASPETYNKACNALSEYGKGLRFSEAGNAYFEEHYEPVCSANALQSLALV